MWDSLNIHSSETKSISLAQMQNVVAGPFVNVEQIPRGGPVLIQNDCRDFPMLQYAGWE